MIARLHKVYVEKSQRGLTLIEIMISLVIGLIIVGGAWALLVNSRASFQTSQNQAKMLDSARFAMQTMGRDIRLAGAFGPLAVTDTSTGILTIPSAMGTASDDCADRFYSDVERKIFGTNGTNPYSGTCILNADYKAGTDILVVRYADNAHPLPNTGLKANQTFIHAYYGRGELFVAGKQTTPVFGSVNATTNRDEVGNIGVFNYRLRTHVYWVSQHTQAGDGIPALHRISLRAGTTGPVMHDEILVSGVEELQIQFGINNCTTVNCGKAVNRYVDGDNAHFGGGTSWSLAATRSVQAVRLWLLVRSEQAERGLDTSGTFTLGSKTITITSAANDSIRRTVYSGTFSLRNSGF